MAIITRLLPCGMPLIIEPTTSVRSAAIMWLIPAGIGHDPANRVGLSPVIAEMLMRGSELLDSRAQADAFDLLGISRDTDVGGSFIRISASLIGDRIGPALDLLCQMVRTPRFEPDAVAPVKDLALQSLAGLKDDPADRAAHLMLARHAPVPLNRSDLGTEEGLKAITVSDVRAQWESRSKPVGSIMAIAGAVDPDAISSQLDAALAGWSGQAEPFALASNPLHGTYHHEVEESNQTHIYLSHDAPPEGTPDAPLERIVASVLSGGSSSRLFTEVRERRGLCYSVAASYSAEKTFGRLGCYVGTTPEKAQQSLDVMTEELRKVTADGEQLRPITSEEFERAKVGTRTRLVFAGESMMARASGLASDMHRLGRPRSLAEITQELERVTLDQVNEYVSRRRMGKATVVTLGPAPLLPR